jgi:hypothetical protein
MIVYIVGTHGAGKTTLSCKIGPDAEVCFREPEPESADEVYEQIAGIPWVTIRIREGQKVQPSLWNAAGELMRHDFSERDWARKLADIPPGASVVRVSADAMYAAVLDGAPATQQAEKMQALNDHLETRFDVVVHETFPLLPPREQDRVVALAVPFSEMRQRCATLQWNDRCDLGRAYYVEAARRAAQPEHRYCHGAKSYSRLWWSSGKWRPVEEVALERINSLGNWYHPQMLAGIYSTNPAVASYEGRWRSLSAFFSENLKGTRLLDIGANSGFNALHLASRGATFVAVEPDARVIEQFRAIVEMGSFPVSVTDQITYHNRPIETEDVRKYGRFDTVIMSACHYYINRSTKEPFKHPAENEIRVQGLRTTLWAVLDAVRQCSDRLLMPTNRDHAKRQKDPYPDADPEWIKRALESLGYRNVTIHPGFSHTPIVEAFSTSRS